MAGKPNKKNQNKKKTLVVVSDQNYRALCIARDGGGHAISMRDGATLCYGTEISSEHGTAIPSSAYFEKVVESKQKEYSIRFARLEWTLQKNKKVKVIPQYYENATIGERTLREKYEREKEDIQQWIKGGNIVASETTPICVLSDEEYNQYKFSIPDEHLIDKQLKRYVRNGIHRIKNKNGSVVTIHGYMVQRDVWFYVSQSEVRNKKMAVEQKAEMTIGKTVLQKNTRKPMKISTNQDVLQLRQWLDDNEKTTGNIQPQRAVRTSKNELPKVQPSNQPILSDTISNTNRIYLYSKKCHCSKCQERYGIDTIVDCRARVRTKKNELVPITVQFCRGCGHFFINYETYQGYNKQYGGLKFKCVLDVSYVPGKSPDVGFAEDSFLSRNGYSVSANVPRSYRQSALAHILDTRIATKHEVIEKITEFINLRRNNPAMNGAVSRWKEDIAFVSNYRIGSQLDVGEKQIVQAGTIKQKT